MEVQRLKDAVKKEYTHSYDRFTRVQEQELGLIRQKKIVQAFSEFDW